MQIGADIADLNTKMDRAQSAVQGGVAKINAAVNALKATAAFGAVVAVIGEVVAAADELDTLSARIDDTAENVQRLQAVSESFDVELGAIIAGIQIMQGKLGDGQLAGALNAIGVEMAAFAAASPSEQFVMVAEALAKIEDPAQRASAASEIFGKNARALAGAFREGVGDVDRWIKMSDGAVTAIDRMSTFFGKLKASLVNASAELAYTISGLRSLDQIREVLSKAPILNVANPQKFAPVLPPGLPKDYADITASLTAGAEASVKLQQGTAKTAIETTKAAAAFKESVAYVHATERGWLVIPNAVESAAAEIAEVRDSMAAMAAISFNTTWQTFQAGVQDSSRELEAVHEKMRIVMTWRDIGVQLSKAVIGAVQGGGDIGRALGGQVGQIIGTKLGDSIGKWAGTAIGGALGASIGGIAGSVVPVIGTIVGSAIGGWIGSKFSNSNKPPTEFQQIQAILESGAFRKLAAEATSLGLSLAGIFDPKVITNLPAFMAAIEGLEEKIKQVKELKAQIADLTEKTTIDFDKMNAVVQEFGLDITKLGPAFQQAALDKEAQRIIDAFAIMEKGGADMTGVLEGMADEISKLVQDAIKFGGTLPENMKPWIQKLIDAGLLLDENGNKITDMSQLKFGEPMKSELEKLTEELDKLIAKLDELVKAITDNLSNALQNLPDIDIDANVNYRYRNGPGGEDNVPGLAAGGIVTRPTFALIGEAGPEAVIPLNSRHMPSGGGVVLNLTLNNGVFDGYASEQQFAQRVLNALTQAGDVRGLRTAFAGG